MSKTRNYRVYKTVFPNGEGYEMKEEDGRGGIGSTSLFDIVSLIKVQMEEIYKADHFDQITLDFTPFHDIEIPSRNLWPRKCLPLSPEEQEEFWKLLAYP